MTNKGTLIAELMTLRKENEQLKHQLKDEIHKLRGQLLGAQLDLDEERARNLVTCTLGQAYDVARTAMASWRDSAADRIHAVTPAPLMEFGLRAVIYTLDDEITRLSQAEGDADLDVVMKSIAGECGIRIIDETG